MPTLFPPEKPRLRSFWRKLILMSVLGQAFLIASRSFSVEALSTRKTLKFG